MTERGGQIRRTDKRRVFLFSETSLVFEISAGVGEGVKDSIASNCFFHLPSQHIFVCVCVPMQVRSQETHCKRRSTDPNLGSHRGAPGRWNGATDRVREIPSLFVSLDGSFYTVI